MFIFGFTYRTNTNILEMNLDVIQEMIKVYLNDVESYDDKNYDESKAVLNDFLLYWREQWDDEDEIAY